MVGSGTVGEADGFGVGTVAVGAFDGIFVGERLGIFDGVLVRGVGLGDG